MQPTIPYFPFLLDHIASIKKVILESLTLVPTDRNIAFIADEVYPIQIDPLGSTKNG